MGVDRSYTMYILVGHLEPPAGLDDRRDETRLESPMPGSVRFRFRRSTEYDMTRHDKKNPPPDFPAAAVRSRCATKLFFFLFFLFIFFQFPPASSSVCVAPTESGDRESLQCSTDHSRPVTLPPWIPLPLAARAINHTYYVVRLPCQFTELAVHILEYTGAEQFLHSPHFL